MTRKAHSADEIVAKLRLVDDLNLQGRTVGKSVRSVIDDPFHWLTHVVASARIGGHNGPRYTGNDPGDPVLRRNKEIRPTLYVPYRRAMSRVHQRKRRHLRP
jgi:hypothetical protein